MPVLEDETTRDPAPNRVAPPDPSGVVVQTAAVPVDEPAAGLGDELAERSDAVLQRHRATVTAARLKSAGRGPAGGLRHLLHYGPAGMSRRSADR